MQKPESVEALTKFGRKQLSPNFFMRDFLYSEIAAVHGLLNAPDHPDRAVEAGQQLCEHLLEPLQKKFGRITIRSAYRSPEVNQLGCDMQKEGKSGYKCSSNEKNYGKHIWDYLSSGRKNARGDDAMGATACIVIPSFWNKFQAPGDWQRLAWWIHDHLPYSSMHFYQIYWAFNLTWSEAPERRIDSHTPWLDTDGKLKTGCLTRPDYANHTGSHEQYWRDIL